MGRALSGLTSLLPWIVAILVGIWIHGLRGVRIQGASPNQDMWLKVTGAYQQWHVDAILILIHPGWMATHTQIGIHDAGICVPPFIPSFWCNSLAKDA